MKNKSLIIGGIVLSLMIVLSIGTYAYWTLTRSQEGENKLIGGCLNVDITEQSDGISLEKAWPISDFEGMQLEGYTFKVTNYCEEPQDYRIDLDRLIDSEGRKEMTNKSLATLLDYGVPVLYSELETGETTDEEVKEKRVLAYDTVMGKVGDTPGSNTHTLRIWIDEESDIEDQGSTFLSRVEINAGQGIEKYYTPEECFTFDSSTGSITAYDETLEGCTTDVVIPYEITPTDATEPVAVTQIGASAFKEKGITSVEFPRSVTTIGNQAFQTNKTLGKIIFKDGLNSIGIQAFSSMNSISNEDRGVLEFVMFPETLTTINGAAFVGNSLKQVIIPDNVTTLSLSKHFAFNEIKDYKIGKGISVLSSLCFRGNFIEKVVIPDHITKLSSHDFGNNPIKEIHLGSGLTYIGSSVFDNYALAGEHTYPVMTNYLTEVYIPDNVTTLGVTVFGSATSDVIIRTERTKEDFLANVTTETTSGYEWYGDAQVISSDGLNIYE
ncbi:MAG: leucine-rich repeat protein [Bacilli bacterium]|nr:leucine-rich repeat protein [Bacilli bacterium]